MVHAVRIVDDPWQLEARLAELQRDLTSDALREAVRAGDLARADCTDFDPTSTPGYEAWRWTVRRLREILSPLGWFKEDRCNLPLVVSPDGDIAIAVTSGDGWTGNPDPQKSPSNKNPKGAMVIDCVQQNRQLRLFEVEEMRTPNPSGRANWLLMIHPESRMTRCELSLPAAIDERGYIFRWRERLILRPIEYDDDFRGNYAFDDGGPDFDVEISPRVERR